MKKNILNEEISKIRKMMGLNEGEMWDMDASNRDTYNDSEDERDSEEDSEDELFDTTSRMIHAKLNEPTEFTFGMYDALESAADEAVSNEWDHMEKNDPQRPDLVKGAMKFYLKTYFKDWYRMASGMFS